MAKLTSKVKAFTLIETIVAMVIVMISVGIATSIFVNVSNSAKSTVRLRAIVAMEELSIEAEKNKRYLDETYEYDAFYIKKTCNAYQVGSNATFLHWESYLPNHKKIAERKEIVLNSTP